MLVFLLLAAVILGFVVLQKQHEKTISAATDTEKARRRSPLRSARPEKEMVRRRQRERPPGKMRSATRAGTRENETESVYLIKGNDTGSNPYEKADHLAYTDSVRYTEEELSRLDSYGLWHHEK